MGKTLVLVGLAIAALGLAVMLGVPLGRLPGDFHVQRGSFSFYFCRWRTFVSCGLVVACWFSFF